MRIDLSVIYKQVSLRAGGVAIYWSHQRVSAEYFEVSKGGSSNGLLRPQASSQ
jgi:hypothetical protein